MPGDVADVHALEGVMHEPGPDHGIIFLRAVRECAHRSLEGMAVELGVFAAGNGEQLHHPGIALKHEGLRPVGEPRHQVLVGPGGPTCHGGDHEEHAGENPTAPDRGLEGACHRGPCLVEDRVGQHVRQRRRVGGETPFDDGAALCDQRLAAVAEACRTDVIDQGRVVDDVGPPGRRGPEAEIVLFAVAAREGAGIEGADLVNAGAANVHAEAVAGRDLGIEPARASGDEAGIGVETQVLGDRVWLARQRRREGSSVVGEGGRGGDALTGIGGKLQVAQPQRRDLRVGVEEHDVGIAGERDAAVDRGGVAEVGPVAHHGDVRQ